MIFENYAVAQGIGFTLIYRTSFRTHSYWHTDGVLCRNYFQWFSHLEQNEKPKKKFFSSGNFPIAASGKNSESK